MLTRISHLAKSVAVSTLALLCLAASAQAAGRIALGVSAGDPGRPKALHHFLSATGARIRFVMWYQSWSEPLFFPSQLRTVEQVRATPIITWDPDRIGEPTRLSDVIVGRFDGYLRTAAESAREYHKPIFIRFAHEMNLRTTFQGAQHHGETSQQFVLAWRHVVDLFRAEHATNVRFVWSPNIDCNKLCPFSSYYPGDQWVDWVALDGYNIGNTKSWSHWTGLTQIFASSYHTLTHLTTKPMMIGETATTASGGDKARWIETALLHDVPVDLPRVRAVVWFDRQKEEDWRVDSSRRSLAAFRAVARTSLYGGVNRQLIRLLRSFRVQGTTHVRYWLFGLASLLVGATAVGLGRRRTAQRRDAARLRFPASGP